jgi:hypothetical protein
MRKIHLLIILGLLLGFSSINPSYASAADVWVYSEDFYGEQINYYVDTNYIGGFKTADIYAIVKGVYPQMTTIRRYSFGSDEGNWYYKMFNGDKVISGKVSDSYEASQVLKVVLDKQAHKY